MTTYVNSATIQRFAADQHYPPGALYVLATPIGNLADITLRALHVLQMADVLACEDTRHTQSLLAAYGIDPSIRQWMAVHEHNEAESAVLVVDRLREGLRVAYLTDAGTPGVSDPGARLVAAVREAGLTIVPLPGASSVTTALSVAGVSDDRGRSGSFVFVGFLPSKGHERAAMVRDLACEARTVVLLEAPHRIGALVSSLATLGNRRVTVGRELTKRFEEIATLAAQDLPAWLSRSAHRQRGEFALVLHPTCVENHGSDERILRLLLPELALKTAVKLTAAITGNGRNGLYELALRLTSESIDGPISSEGML